MIAAESVFLNDAERGEASHRLAERCAFFLSDSSNYSRLQLFWHMRRAYLVRNIIVHGGTPKPQEMQLPTNGPRNGNVSLEQFADFTENLLRLALRKAILTPKTHGSSSADWAELILR
jgi:hypothetical protein